MALLRNYALRWIPTPKVRDYLLDLNHSDGASKANFFINTCGFTRFRWTALKDALMAQPLVGDAKMTAIDQWGELWEVTGPIIAPNGKSYIIRTCWIFKGLNPRPQLTTAKPGEK